MLVDQHRLRSLLSRKTHSSQLGQDVVVQELLGNIHGGYFVEIGAADGEHWSNTWSLERDYGWKGILCDPMIKNVEKRINSTLELYPVFNGSFVDFQQANEDTMYSTIKESGKRKKFTYTSVELPSITPIQLLKAHKAPKFIDYVSIDVEGAEEDILKLWPWEKYDVKVWSVEHNYDQEKRNALAKLFESKGYSIMDLKWDLIARKNNKRK